MWRSETIYRAGRPGWAPSCAFNWVAVAPGCARSYIARQHQSINISLFSPFPYLRTQLSRPHLLLHIHNLLLLRKRQRPRHTQEKHARAQNEQRLAAEAERRLDVRGGGGDGGGDGVAGCWWNDVAQSEETVGQGLVKGREVFVVGADLGVWRIC